VTKSRGRHEPELSQVAEALMGTSLVYTDACTSMDGEEETDARRGGKRC
jgi:hypothetical protein